MSSPRSCAGWTPRRSSDRRGPTADSAATRRLDIAVVQHVVRMADDGMTLAGIRRILTLEAEVADLQRQIADLQAATST